MFLLSLIMILSCLSGCFQQEVQYLTMKGYTGCLCPGDTLTYECTVVGGNTLVWRGSALSCPSTDNEIVLLLSDRISLSKSCNNGTVTAKFIRIADTYISQLNVTWTRDLIGESIECMHEYDAIEDANVTVTFGSLNISNGLTVIHKPLEIIPEPICPESKMVFSWSPFITNCSILHYSISSSNCGSCPTTSTHTNITCTNAPLNGSVCTISVHAFICGNVTSEPLTWTSVINTECADKATGIQLIITVFGTSFVVILIAVLMLLSVLLTAFRSRIRKCCSTKAQGEAVYDDVKDSSSKEETELTPNIAYGYVSKRPTTAAM